jgi:hypothetical protein
MAIAAFADVEELDELYRLDLTETAPDDDDDEDDKAEDDEDGADDPDVMPQG